MYCTKYLSKRSVIVMLALTTLFSQQSINILFAAQDNNITSAPATSSTELNPQSSPPLVPNVCPPESGTVLPTKTSPVASQPILIPAQKPNQSIYANTDKVITTGLSPKKIMKTTVPAVTPAPVPDTLKKPITLDQALQIAFKNSPDIQAALSQVENYRGVVDQARAMFNPTFSVQASTTFQGPITTIQSTNGGSTSMIASPDKEASLSVTLPLDVSHQLKYSSDIAKYNFQIQYLSMVSVSEQLIVDVKNAYYELLRNCGQKAVAQAAVDSAGARLENIKAKFEEGAAPKYDVTSAEVELDNYNQELMTAQNNVNLAQASLNQILGVDVNYPTQIVSIDVPITINLVDIPKSVKTAYAHRPEVKAAQSQVTLSQTNVKLQRTGLLPSLSLSGGPNYDFTPTGYTSNNFSWSAGVILSMSIWDGGVTKAKVRQAKAGVQNSIATLNQQKLAVAKEVRQYALNLQNAALRTQTTAHAVSLAEDALSIANDRYNAGVAVLVEVTNAQSQLSQARFNYVDALYDYAIALAQLQRATSCQPELNQLQLLADQNQARPNVKEAQS